ncbi:MAG: AarF/UbiB family protein [Lachnospiraceae bacterium]|nr:AarF/UbiB family protein [Lachnospiraceae bacterium]
MAGRAVLAGVSVREPVKKSEHFTHGSCAEKGGPGSISKRMPYDEVISIIEESCGCPWNQVFSWIQKTPQGSASIAQVHRARLRSGEQVVVKIQRRGICEIMTRDIRLLHRLLRFLPTGAVKNMVDLDQMLDDIWAATREEMNFVMEAAYMQEFSRRNKGIRKQREEYSSLSSQGSRYPFFSVRCTSGVSKRGSQDEI